MSKGQGIGPGAWLLFAVAVLPVVVLAVMLGPDRALRIAGAAVLSTAVDGFVEQPGEHRIPLLDIHVDPAHLDTLNADLPWSGGRMVPAELHYNGIHHQVRFRYRGALTPLHFLGGKKSFRLSVKGPPPHLPFRRVNVMNPKSFNMLNNHMGLWIGGFMGVAVPHDEIVFVRLNGRDHGVMELLEQPDGRFERVRGVHDAQVPVFKGDFGPVQGRALGAINLLWSDAAHWQFVGNADSTEAMERLRELVSVVVADTMALEERRDAIERLVDVEAWLRFIAAMQVVNTTHIDQVHNQVIVLNPRTGRFYPVFWDPLLMYAQPDGAMHYVHDALAYWMLQVPDWRLRKDRHVHEALSALHHKGLFLLHWRSTEERIMPSVLADRNKYGNVTMEAEDVHRFSILHTMSGSQNMRRNISAYWDRLSARLAATGVEVVRSDDAIRLRTTAEAPLRLRWNEDEGPVAVLLNEEPLLLEPVPGGYSVLLHRQVEYAGPSDDRFAMNGHFRVLPLEVTLQFPMGVPPSLVITNAITDEEVR
jgi:hypothetical protein